jgi:DNA repair exonuclease SbcCD ATPase subunit
MSFENFPESEKTEKEVPEATNNAPRNILTIALVIALLGTWGYILWDKNKVKEKDITQQNLIASTSSQRDELQKELEDATMRYDNLKTANSKKDSAINVKDREIEEKRSRINALLSKVNATESELSEARNLIGSLKNDIEGYRKQIEVLQGVNTQLTQEKETVTEERNKARREFDSAQNVIKGKEDVINVGSTLHASNFTITGINEKSSGKEKETSTAKKVDKLRISFDLDENLIAQSGKKDIYVCITAPDGTPVAVEALGSGKFTTREGLDKLYTQKIEVNYTQNKRQTISFDWKQNSNFSTGNYKIEVYNNGFKVGEAIKPLKKGGLFG